jgi:sensor histidine kinase regulating citrate/malate metabolism
MKIEVVDTGFGFDEATKRAMFKTGSGLTDSANCSGIGLWLTKKIAEALKGEIT